MRYSHAAFWNPITFSVFGSTRSYPCIDVVKFRVALSTGRLRHTRFHPIGVTCCPCGAKIYTPCLKNVPPLACYHFDAQEWILIFFGRSVTYKVGNQKTLYYATSKITCASALPGKTRKHENHIFHSIGLCYTHNTPVRYLPERKNCHMWCVW